MGVTVKSSLNHCTVGTGLPLAIQYNTAKLPTPVMQGDIFGMEMTGQSKEMNKH